MTLPTNNQSSNNQPRAWYKEPWLWLVIALPVAAVIAGISTVIIAYLYADDLVVDDYYKVGIAINQNIESQRKAHSLGIHGRLFFSGQKIQLQLRTTINNDFPDRLMLELFHPTLKQKDFAIELLRLSAGFYSAEFNNPKINGHRYLRITPPANNWVLKQDINIEIGQAVNLDAR